MPTGDVCMSSNNFTLFIVIAIGIVFFCLYRTYHLQELHVHELERAEGNCPVCPIAGFTGSSSGALVPESDRAGAGQQIGPYAIPSDPVFRIERDPWITPVRPNPWTPVTVPQIATQGPYGAFAQVGFITKKNTKKPEKRMMPLYGRRAYGYQFEYYVINPYNGIKIPLSINGNKELYNEDEVYIPEMSEKYIVSLYDYWG